MSSKNPQGLRKLQKTLIDLSIIRDRTKIVMVGVFDTCIAAQVFISTVLKFHVSFIVSRRYPGILRSDWFRERAVFSYLLTTGMVTDNTNHRVKLRIERSKFQNMKKKKKKKTKAKTKTLTKKHDKHHFSSFF